MAKKKISFIVGALGLQVLRILEKSKKGLTVNQVTEKSGALASTTENHMRRFVALGLVDNTQKAPTKEPRRGQPERLYVWLGREYEVTDLDDHHQSLKSEKTLAKEARKAAKTPPQKRSGGRKFPAKVIQPENVKARLVTPAVRDEAKRAQEAKEAKNQKDRERRAAKKAQALAASESPGLPRPPELAPEE